MAIHFHSLSVDRKLCIIFCYWDHCIVLLLVDCILFFRFYILVQLNYILSYQLQSCIFNFQIMSLHWTHYYYYSPINLCIFCNIQFLTSVFLIILFFLDDFHLLQFQSLLNFRAWIIASSYSIDSFHVHVSRVKLLGSYNNLCKCIAFY